MSVRGKYFCETARHVNVGSLHGKATPRMCPSTDELGRPCELAGGRSLEPRMAECIGRVW